MKKASKFDLADLAHILLRNIGNDFLMSQKSVGHLALPVKVREALLCYLKDGRQRGL
jgi:hypothetical protein